MKRSPVARKAAKLSDSLHHQLNMYAVAAGAAGVLALTPSAGAKIVFTPAHRNFQFNKNFFLDMNHDGSDDFKFAFAHRETSSSMFRNDLRVGGVRPGNSVVFMASQQHEGSCAVALPKWKKVGPKSPFMKRSAHHVQHVCEYVRADHLLYMATCEEGASLSRLEIHHKWKGPLWLGKTFECHRRP